MREYECNICNTEVETVTSADYDPVELGICTKCWFQFLTGSDRKAIAERVGA